MVGQHADGTYYGVKVQPPIKMPDRKRTRHTEGRPYWPPLSRWRCGVLYELRSYCYHFIVLPS